MEAAERLLRELPEETHRLVRGCLATLYPKARASLLRVLCEDLVSVEQKLYCIFVVEQLYAMDAKEPAAQAECLIEAMEEPHRDARTLLELHYAFPLKRWLELVREFGEKERSRCLEHCASMSIEEKCEIGSLSGAMLPMRAVAALLEKTPPEACQLCREKRAHAKQFALCRDEDPYRAVVEAREKNNSDSITVDDGLYTFETSSVDNNNTETTLAKLGLEDSPERVVYEGWGGRKTVDTSLTCRNCRDEVYAYVSRFGHDREIWHTTGTQRLKCLVDRKNLDEKRARWWSFEKDRQILGKILDAVRGARRGIRQRALQDARFRQDAEHARILSDTQLAEAAALDAVLKKALALDPKWTANVAKTTEKTLSKRTVYAALQGEKEYRLDHPSSKHGSSSKRWDAHQVENNGVSSQKREISEAGVPLTAYAASVIFGTTPLVVPDETALLRTQRTLASQCESELEHQRNVLGKHDKNLLDAHKRISLENWALVSRTIEENRLRRLAREENEREKRRQFRQQERIRLRQLRTELRAEGQRRASLERQAVDDALRLKQRQLDAERAERLGMMFAEAHQCAIDRFWGLENEILRQRRLEQLRRLVWLARLSVCNVVMRKTESILPFFKDELERRKPPE